MTGPLGIIVNPFSGRDVRRVAARASISDHHEKQQQVSRLVLGALSQGAPGIFLAHEPFRINERAVEHLPEKGRVEILKFRLTHTAEDTATMAGLMWQAGCRVFIVLGGDGTSRIVARRLPEATLLPLSTGTNNVFPCRLEASVAGMAAGLVAAGSVSAASCRPCKRISIRYAGGRDIALVDAVLLRDDCIGSLLPFAADRLATIVLARAEPAAIGVSPIGGYLLPAGHHDDHGVLVECGRQASNRILAPLAPGLHQEVGVREFRKLALDEPVEFRGPGVLAFDGDRVVRLAEGEVATACVRRDGPGVIEAERVMAAAAQLGLFKQACATGG